MKHILTWCDIPVTDMARAKSFYSETLGVTFLDQPMDDMEGAEMSIFVADADAISGALVKFDEQLPSSTHGTVAYLNAGHDLSLVVARAEKLGAKVLWPKTAIQDGEVGYFAQISDSEGNRLGLFSPN